MIIRFSKLNLVSTLIARYFRPGRAAFLILTLADWGTIAWIRELLKIFPILLYKAKSKVFSVLFYRRKKLKLFFILFYERKIENYFPYATTEENIENYSLYSLTGKKNKIFLVRLYEVRNRNHFSYSTAEENIRIFFVYFPTGENIEKLFFVLSYERKNRVILCTSI